MNPIVHVRAMHELSAYKRKKLCEHTPQCDKFLIISTLDEGMTMCEKDAIAYSNTIFQTLHVHPEVICKKIGWDDGQVKELIEYIRANDIHYGIYTTLAERFGKTRKQVKDKVFYLRDKGAF